MNASLFSAVQATNEDHLSVHSGCGPVSSASPEAHMPVGVHRLSFAELEAAIQRAGNAMERAYGDYQLTGNENDLDRAYRHMQQMRELVGMRSPEVVRQMEQERGIS